MEQYKIYFEKLESIYSLENQVRNENIMVCDDIQNTYMIIQYDDAHRIGIAYYDYGIPLAFLYAEDCRYLYLGFGMKLLCIDLHVNKAITNKNLQSIFYEFIYDSNKNYVCVVCELDLYCYHENDCIWKIGFRDIVCAYKIVDDSKISIECNDGMEYLFSLENGSIIE